MESAITTQISSFLSFGLGKEIFAVNVSKVLEILEITQITKVPNSPDYMRGVINLRGSVLPVVSTRAIFGLPEIEDTVDTCIIVLDIELNGELLKIGTLVDSVKEVLDINQEEMEPAPSLGKKFRSDFILGMWKQEEEFIMVLDIDKVFSADELIGVEELKETV
ncbi:MAG: chemotaxis protein CheW [Bacteroidota bacterium]